MFFCLSSRRSNLRFVQKSHKAGECLSVSLLKTGKYVCSLCSNTPRLALCFSASGSLNSGFAQSGRLICDGCLAAQDWHICVVSLLKMRQNSINVFLALFFWLFQPGLCSKQIMAFYMAVSLLKTVNYVWFLCLEFAVDTDYAFLPFLSGSVKIESLQSHVLLSPLLDSGFLKSGVRISDVLSSRFWQLVSRPGPCPKQSKLDSCLSSLLETANISVSSSQNRRLRGACFSASPLWLYQKDHETEACSVSALLFEFGLFFFKNSVL